MSTKCYIIAEAGLNHNGSMELARNLIDVVASAGADAVKFQKRNVGSLAVGHVLDARDNRFPGLGTTYRQIRERLEFNFEQYQELKEYVESRGLDFLCTPFDHQSVDFLERLGVNSYKVASHSNTNLPLLKEIAAIGKSVYMSTGACTLEELDDAVEVFKSRSIRLTLLHCVSSYPTPVEEVNLGMIDFYRKRYEVPVGYSGHEIGYIPTIAAVALGAAAVERHFTMDKGLAGFDHKLSLEPAELKAMLKDIRAVEESLGITEKSVTEREIITRNKYKVSMASRQAISKGTIITAEMITYKNPGTGIHPRDADKVLGKKAAVDIPEDVLIQPNMVA